jgi:WD40-like Beta Propeller Repeat
VNRDSPWAPDRTGTPHTPIARLASRFTVHRFLFTLFPLIACGTLPPLRGKIDVGRESYAVFVGGSGLNGDLYAVRANGGPAYPITFTTVAELRPALSPDGTTIAFLRGVSLRDSTPATVWVMNLLNGADRELRLPKGAGSPEKVGWTPDGSSVVVRTRQGLYRLDAPPAKANARAIPPEERAAAESSLAVLLGRPVFAQVVPCRQPEDLCVVSQTGRPDILAQAAADPVRWGADSVAFFTGELFQIRPLAKGRPRLLNWSEVPAHPRQLTYFQAPVQPQQPQDQM